MASIVFDYPASNPFHPTAYETEGVGGSEASLILASRALAGVPSISFFFHSSETFAAAGG